MSQRTPQRDPCALITTAELATLWSVSPASLKNARSKGNNLIKPVKVGRSIRYRYADAIAFIDGQ